MRPEDGVAALAGQQRPTAEVLEHHAVGLESGRPQRPSAGQRVTGHGAEQVGLPVAELQADPLGQPQVVDDRALPVGLVGVGKIGVDARHRDGERMPLTTGERRRRGQDGRGVAPAGEADVAGAVGQRRPHGVVESLAGRAEGVGRRAGRVGRRDRSVDPPGRDLQRLRPDERVDSRGRPTTTGGTQWSPGVPPGLRRPSRTLAVRECRRRSTPDGRRDVSSPRRSLDPWSDLDGSDRRQLRRFVVFVH